jgi:hypothetical protein
MQIIALLAVVLLPGCTSLAERTVIADQQETSNKDHPRALLLQRVMPSCLWWCTATTTVTNSEGVRAQGTGGSLMSSEAQTSATSTIQSYSPTNKSGGGFQQ